MRVQIPANNCEFEAESHDVPGLGRHRIPPQRIGKDYPHSIGASVTSPDLPSNPDNYSDVHQGANLWANRMCREDPCLRLAYRKATVTEATARVATKAALYLAIRPHPGGCIESAWSEQNCRGVLCGGEAEGGRGTLGFTAESIPVRNERFPLS